MTARIRIILGIVALIAGLWLAYIVADYFYLGHRRELVEQIRSLTQKVNDRSTAIRNQKKIDAQLQQIIDRTLGGDIESVDHFLRTRLSRLAEHIGLQNTPVDTTKVGKPIDSPAKSKFSGGAYRLLREEHDFYELEGWISGTGTFEQVLRLVDGIDAEPWIKRIDSLKLDPRENGSRFDFTIRLTTLYLPKGVPNPANITAVSAAGFDRYMALVNLNPFRVPPPAPPPPTTPDPKPMTDPGPPVPPPFPYDQWTLTGIADSAGGPEVWLLNQQTHESKRLAIGESLHEAMFVATNIDAAEFKLGDQRFRVSVGKNLSDRTSLNQ